jgi:hypothetical protein
VEEVAFTHPVTAAYVIDHVFTGADGSRRERLPADCAGRAVGWIRIQARRYAADVPEDHPIWDWTVTRHRGTEQELRSTGSAAVSFDLGAGEGRVSWTVSRARDDRAAAVCNCRPPAPGAAGGLPGPA